MISIRYIVDSWNLGPLYFIFCFILIVLIPILYHFLITAKPAFLRKNSLREEKEVYLFLLMHIFLFIFTNINEQCISYSACFEIN